MNTPTVQERYDSVVAIRERRIQVRYRAGVGEDASYRAACARAEEVLWRDTDYAEHLYRRLAAYSIVAWDAEDRNGRLTPITEEALDPLPIGALQRIVREATQLGARTWLEQQGAVGGRTSGTPVGGAPTVRPR